MKKFKSFLRLLVLVLVFATPISSVNAANNIKEDTSAAQGCHGLDAQLPLLGDSPFSNTQAVFLYEQNTDTLLYAWNADERMYPSSLTKLVTAIIAVEEGDLTATVTANAQVLNDIPNDAVSVYLEADEEMTLMDLIYCMMVGSGNDASAVIANHIGGNVSAFAEQMNTFVEQLGCTGTHFVNPHGLHDDEQYTTARDMGKILSYAAKNDTLREIMGTVHYNVPATNKSDARDLFTNNDLIYRGVMEIYYDGRVVGGRIGTTYDGKRTVASIAEKGNMELISIVMGSSSTYHPDGYSIKTFGGFPETSKLLDLGFQNMHGAQIFYEGQVLKQYSVPGGDCDLFLGVNESVSTVLPTGVDLDDLRLSFHETGILSAPIDKDSVFGVVQVWYNSTCVASVKLYALNSVSLQNQLSTDERIADDDNPISIGWILLGVFIAFVIFLVALRYSKRLRRIVFYKRRRRRRR